MGQLDALLGGQMRLRLFNVFVVLDGIDHKVQEALSVLCWFHRGNGMRILSQGLPEMLGLLDVVVRRQNVNDTEEI